MKKTISVLIAAVIFLFSASAYGEIKYIREIRNVILRESPNLESKEIKMLNSGDSLDILEEKGRWTKITTADGISGWVASRFLTDNIPLSAKYKKLEYDYRSLVKKSADIGKELESTKQNLLEIEQNYEICRKETADKLKLENRFAKLSKKSDKMQEKIEILERREIFKWFLCGALVLLGGFVLGYNTSRKKHRSSLL